MEAGGEGGEEERSERRSPQFAVLALRGLFVVFFKGEGNAHLQPRLETTPGLVKNIFCIKMF